LFIQSALVFKIYLTSFHVYHKLKCNFTVSFCWTKNRFGIFISGNHTHYVVHTNSEFDYQTSFGRHLLKSGWTFFHKTIDRPQLY